MKPKNKMIALLEIAVVLCSLFLVSVPAITAASAIYEPGPLDVYGNANEDDTIDMRDLTYVKLIFFGKKPETELADAKYDGKINPLDFIQIKLIIVGKERELTYIDILGEAETVKKPIKRLANLGYNGVEMTRTLGAVDMVVAVGSDRSAHSTFFPKISKLPAVGTVPDCDFEKILSLEPDAVQTNIEAGWALLKGPENKRMFKEKLPGMPLISLNMREPDVLVRNVRTYGYIIDREDEAEEFIDWFEDLYLNTFKARIDGLSEDKKPKAYFEYTPYYCYASGSRLGQVLVGAGGNNMIDEIVGPDHPNYGGMLDVEREFIVKENPDFIFKAVGSWISGYDIDNPSEIAAKRQQVLDRPELVNVNAVKNKRVYSVSFWILGGAGQTIIGTAYLAKLFHPDLFEDMDPQAIHQEYLDRFCRIDFNVKEHGTFVYPSYEEWPAI